ncbi:DUF3592 domain-containing protein [Mucilaginibacter sp. NFX135]|uniref:DUF3592 domain-containing protein n=1 Tax=Mucilaginibacter sp. NFX135 TaxID=3402687 RepID=UPI003AFA5B72
MNVSIDELLLLASGAFLVVLGIGKLNERRKLLKTGAKVDGVVFSVEEEWGVGTRRSRLYYPVIRYVTIEKEWVTKRYEVGTYPPAYNEGDHVTVIYDLADIEHYIIDNITTKLLGPVFIILGILLMLGVGAYYILNQYQPG